MFSDRCFCWQNEVGRRLRLWSEVDSPFGSTIPRLPWVVGLRRRSPSCSWLLPLVFVVAPGMPQGVDSRVGLRLRHLRVILRSLA